MNPTLRWPLAVLCIGLAILFMAGPQKDNNKAVPEKPAVPNVEKHDDAAIDESKIRIEEREAAWAEWLACAEHVVLATRDEEAGQVLAYLRKEAILGAPLPGEGYVLKTDQQQGGPMQFVVLALLDRNEETLNRHTRMGDMVGRFIGGNSRSLVLPKRQISKTWKGIVVLHEGSHARMWVTEKPREQPGADKGELIAKEETRVFRFQQRLTSIIGGERYKLCVDAEKARIHAEMKRQKITLADSISVDSPTYDTLLDDVFGPALSQDEKTFRQGHLWLHAYMEIFKEELGPKAEETTLRFMKAYYTAP